MPNRNLYQSIAEELGPDAHSMRAWLALLSCFSTIERALMRHFAQEFNSGLPRYDVLTALAMFPRGLTMTQLARKLMVTKGNITGVVRRLKQDELVTKTTSKTDRRIQRVAITPAGRELWEKMKQDYEALVIRMMSGLPDQQADTFCRMLEDTRSAIQQAAARPDS